MKKSIGAFLAAALCAAVISGCGSNNTPAATAQTPAAGTNFL